MNSTRSITQPIAIWGAGGHALVLRDLLSVAGHFTIEALFSDTLGIAPFSSPVYVGESQIREWAAEHVDHHFAIAIGLRGDLRVAKASFLRSLLLRPTILIHPKANVASEVTLGEGCQVLAFAHVGPRAAIGTDVIINTRAIVEHECVVGDGSDIAPGAVVLGRARIGRCVLVGANATILPGVSICDNARIGAGAVVTKDIAKAGDYIGLPARMRAPVSLGF